MKNCLILDFDGTIADAVPLIREIYAEIASKRGFPQIDDETYSQLRKGSVKDVLKWVGVKPWQLPSALKEGRKLFADKSDQVNLYDGVPELIKKLSAQAWDIYILSSNSEKTIKNILKRYDLDNLIVILKRPPIFGKANSINKLVKKNNYQKSKVWMVGDEVRDVVAGKKAGVNTLSVSWGLQDQELLKKNKPTHLVSTVAKMSEILIGAGD